MEVKKTTGMLDMGMLDMDVVDVESGHVQGISMMPVL